MRWEFAIDLPNGAIRKPKLENAPAFKDICSSIFDNLRVLCRHQCKCDIADGFLRVEFCVSVEKDQFDQFFNSENGYRAAYFKSVDGGKRANSDLIQLLSPKLLSFEDANDVDPRLASLSIGKSSAKIWILEAAKGQSNCKYCGDGCGWKFRNANSLQHAEILNDRWELSEAKSSWGRKAPYFSLIQIKGAFVNSNGEEFLPSDKADRAQEISCHGWT